MTQRVTHPPQTKPVMKRFIQSRSRLSQTPKKAMQQEAPYPTPGLRTPLRPQQPGITPFPQPQGGPGTMPGASESRPTLARAHLLKHSGTSFPARCCCQNWGSAAPKRQEENLARRRGRVQGGGQASPAHTTQPLRSPPPLHPPWVDRKVALGGFSHGGMWHIPMAMKADRWGARPESCRGARRRRAEGRGRPRAKASVISELC